MISERTQTPLRSRPDYGTSHFLVAMTETASTARSSRVASCFEDHIVNGRNTRYSSLSREREVRLDLKSLPKEISETVMPLEIEQGYLAESEDGDTMVRVRKTQNNDGSFSYTITAKNYPSYAEAESDIDQAIYDGLHDLISKIERKKRYKWNGWDIDVISEGNRAGRVVAEYELPPDQITVVMPELFKSVTGQKDQGSI